MIDSEFAKRACRSQGRDLGLGNAAAAPARRSRSRCPSPVSRWSALSARKRQPVFGARGEHAVRLGDAARHQVVDHDADIAFGAVEDDRRARRRRARGVEAGDQALRGRLLVAGGAVDLAGQEEPGHALASPASARARADRRSRIRSRSRAASSARVPAREWSRAARAARPPAARSRCRSDRPCRRRALPARGRSGGRRARRSARSCPRSTGNSAARGSAIWPEYIGERCRLARMIAWVAARGAGDAALRSAGCRSRSVSIENGSGGSSPGCISSAAQSMVRPSSRGGVPVLSRPERKAAALQRRATSPSGGRLADAARPAILLLADMDQAAQERAGGQHHGAGARARGHPPGARPRPRRPRSTRSSTSPSITVRFGGLADRALHRRGVELAVGLRARPAHRRALAAVEHAKLDAAAVGDAAHQPVERVDLAHQMALAEPADRRIAGHRADGREAVRDQRRRARPCARPRPRPRSRHGRRRSR